MKTIFVNDRVSYAISKREYTDEGFLKVPGRVARTGIQEYLASELGITDCDPNKLIKVYRPDTEVFNVDSMSSYDGVDVTIEHPKGFVTSDTYKDVSVGFVKGSARQDDSFLVVDLIVKAKDGITAVESGKVQLSAGYSATYDEAPGETPQGENYDYIQRDIRVNHVALVDRARAGAQARLFDNRPEDKKMTHKVTLDSGRSVEIEDQAAATLVNDHIDRVTKRATDAEAKSEKMEAEKDAMSEELEEEKKKSSDSAIAARVESIAKVTADARKVAGDKFTCDSVNITAIQRAALTAKRPDIKWADKSEVYVQAAFDHALELGTHDEGVSQEQLAKLAQDASRTQEPKISAYDNHRTKIQDAWKGGVQ